MNTKLRITEKQEAWLDTHGDRNAGDVLENERGLYVLMGSGRGPRGYMDVYLPSDEEIDIENAKI